MQVRVPLLRAGYRLAYRGLRVYWFLTRPDVDGVKCVLTDGQRVLLVRHSYGPRAWELPGGSIKRRERPLNAARREMAEELGVTIEQWTPLGEVRGRMHYRHDILHCFQAEVGGSELILDPVELLGAGWFAGDQLPEDVGGYVRPILALTR